ncbi:zinc-dependent alcohol dehydrogenase family protein [Mucilaginibacter rubeus]|uniref:enoyl-[acyl-carrier-protein] reductase n=1 Tax=Mucilaginibacter rubeus TaxID=2027860 RepID=A0AAE6MKA5_9SPHI|nr:MULTISPECIES: zinc-dependent alcohol dehydrogenase family protein [Mucilaginibacter]QEM06486.1 zinc-dependent alcohol dehydrogenase family protein [Mucilaginibacter rubeus]QEM19072.1 zinc-dependent alcohol dehydrogenase family protein [Mucilaginibacter gossypii]QTE44386.1 zinc-dependent alcohol dehydrogenase family protein [Mucilaginibacter rubeus]QTE50985.1 zinc-dependent alcohol dehydrogenase family protein [Mucilaginibacter rubeus]QTE56069.1 zinc-dependent alcohol dehydrogenase family pr
MATDKKIINQPIKQLRLIGNGQPEDVVELHEGVITSLGPNEVLVEMEAAPIHISDFMLVGGIYGVKPSLPATLGAEGIGRVIDVGSGHVKDYQGKRVIILPYYEQGTWATYLVAPLKNIVIVDEGIDATQLAQLTINAVTAFLTILDYSELNQGDWIGQTAANSAVGQYVIGLAKINGWKTLNIVRRAESAEFVRSIGGDEVVIIGDNLGTQIEKALDGKQLDHVLDTVGGTTIGTIAGFLKSRGSIVGYSSESGQTPVIRPLDLFYRRLHYHGFWVIDWFRITPKEQIDRLIQHLTGLVDEGRLSATVGGTFPIEKYKEAFQAAKQPGRPGKYFLTFNQ